MKVIICVFSLFAALLLVYGCDSSPRTSSQPFADIDTPSGMIEYLNSKNLPALENVEVWENPYGPGLKITTRHYEVYTTLLEPLMLSQVPGFMEACFDGYNKQVPIELETENLFSTYIFATREQWEAFTDDFTGPAATMHKKIRSGAYVFNQACVSYNIGRGTTFNVLGHEGWHQFTHRFFRFRLPSWLDEGIAMQFETARYQKGKFIFEPSRNMNRLAGLKVQMLNRRIIPLENLLAMNPGEAVMHGGEATSAFYSQAYAMVRFLREEDYGKRLMPYLNMTRDGLEGKWPLTQQQKEIAGNRNIPLTVGWNRQVGPKIFAEYISNDFQTLENEYLRYCQKITYHVRLTKPK